MKTFICSDLHTEFFPVQEHDILFEHFPETEAIIVAGDLTSKTYLEYDIELLCKKYKDVFFVTGNHEYYYSSFPEIHSILNNITFKNFHWLNNSNHNNILGTTLWFEKSPLNHTYQKLLNDFNLIKDFESHVYELNKEAKKFLSSINEDSIVVTHHLPCCNSIPNNYKNSELNRFFLCVMEKVMLEKQPKIWIHGHTHSSNDYMVGNTRVICNPFGYKHSLNKDFSFETIIDI